GRDLANPTSLIESVAMLLAWLEERGRGEKFAAASQRIMSAVDATLTVPALRTRDLGGPLRTNAFTEQVIARLAHAEHAGRGKKSDLITVQRTPLVPIVKMP